MSCRAAQVLRVSHTHCRSRAAAQVNAEAMSARSFTSWRQSVLLGIHKVVKDKGGLFAQHTHVLGFLVDAKEHSLTSELPNLADYAAEF